MALPDEVAFYAWVAATWAFCASVAVAVVRGWVRGRGLRPEDVATRFHAAMALLSGELYGIAIEF